MSNVNTDAYWANEFAITAADLDRIAAHIGETREAHDLTLLTERVIRGRLVYGPESGSHPALEAQAGLGDVRLWDFEASWRPGDHAIVAVNEEGPGRGRLRPYIGEVIDVVEHIRVVVQIDALGECRKLTIDPKHRHSFEQWRRNLESMVQDWRSSQQVDETAKYVLVQHGERVASQLLDALRADARFVRLAGRWFLRELAAPPSEDQLSGLAWAMIALEESKPTADLVPLVEPPVVKGDRGLFGLYLAMRDHPDLFENADPGQRPRWRLCGPPSGTCTPRNAAFDPETFEVLCLPGEPASSGAVQRLWELDLLRAVMAEMTSA